MTWKHKATFNTTTTCICIRNTAYLRLYTDCVLFGFNQLLEVYLHVSLSMYISHRVSWEREKKRVACSNALQQTTISLKRRLKLDDWIIKFRKIVYHSSIMRFCLIKMIYNSNITMQRLDVSETNRNWLEL